MLNSNKQQRGANLVEYAMLITLIFLIALAATRVFSSSASSQFSFVASNIGGAL